jgi:hypothetical protein
MATLLTLPARERPTAQVLDLSSERRRMRREARQSAAVSRVMAELMAAFPDATSPADLAALIALAVERLGSNPDFGGEVA